MIFRTRKTCTNQKNVLIDRLLFNLWCLCTDLEAGSTREDVGGRDEPLVDHVRGLGPVPSAGPVDGPLGVEGGHAASTLKRLGRRPD